MSKATFYWKSTCTSCRTARGVVQGKGYELEDVNYAKKGLPEATVKAIVAAAGSVAKVLNTRHEIAKAKGWGEKPPSVAEFAAAVAKEPNLIRRPVFIRGKQVLIGYDKTNAAEWDALK